VCGRRDAVLPRHVQKDPETSLTWTLKDQLLRRGKVYTRSWARGKATFIAPRLLPYFNAIWGVRPSKRASSQYARARGAERVATRMGNGLDRSAQGVRCVGSNRFTRALDELQAAMVVIPSEAVYLPKFTYLWTLAVSRFPDDLMQRSIATSRCARSRAHFSAAPADDTRRARARRRIVAARSRTRQSRARREGYATMSAPGFYELASKWPSILRWRHRSVDDLYRYSVLRESDRRTSDQRPSFDEICTKKPSGSLRLTVDPRYLPDKHLSLWHPATRG